MSTSFSFDPRCERLPAALGQLDLAQALSRLRARSRPVLLDSAAGEPCHFSLLAFDPLPHELSISGTTYPAALRDTLSALRSVSGATRPTPFFAGGFLGALSYDLGVVGEELDLPADPWGLPRLVGGLYTDYLLRDHRRGETTLVLGHEPGDGRPPVEQRRREILSALDTPAPERAVRTHRPLCSVERPELFAERVELVRDEIERGEIYQANLSRRMQAGITGDPIDLYLALRAAHPGPYAGYVGAGDFAILSGSPELLLEFEPADETDGTEAGNTGGARAITRPIKGTAPRGATPEQDRRRREALLASEKDLAELTMIVDLERNDLGRVARAGSVSVGPFPRLQSFTSVHHLCADVEADVRDEFDGVDVLASLFPGGSITGAPKLRSMEVIAALEGEGRGFAYGSMVALDLTGRVHANLLIRSLTWRARGASGEVSYRVGAGITWGSRASEEEAETRAKELALAGLFEPDCERVPAT